MSEVDRNHSSLLSKYSEQKVTLMNMGFDSSAVSEALATVKGNLEAATAILLGDSAPNVTETISSQKNSSEPSKSIKTSSSSNKKTTSSITVSTVSSRQQAQAQASKLESREAIHYNIMATYKVQKCKEKGNHDKRFCPLWHSRNDRRRNPFEFPYTCVECPNSTETQACDDGDACTKAHNMIERMFHPELFKISKCQRGPNGSACERGNYCAFAHSEEDHRIPLSQQKKNAAQAAAHATAAAATHSSNADTEVPSATTSSSATGSASGWSYNNVTQGGTSNNAVANNNNNSDVVQDRLIRLIRNSGTDGILSSELPKKYYETYNERLELMDEGGERLKIKELLSHPSISVVMHRGVQPKYVCMENTQPSATTLAPVSVPALLSLPLTFSEAVMSGANGAQHQTSNFTPLKNNPVSTHAPESSNEAGNANGNVSVNSLPDKPRQRPRGPAMAGVAPESSNTEQPPTPYGFDANGVPLLQTAPPVAHVTYASVISQGNNTPVIPNGQGSVVVKQPGIQSPPLPTPSAVPTDDQLALATLAPTSNLYFTSLLPAVSTANETNVLLPSSSESYERLSDASNPPTFMASMSDAHNISNGQTSNLRGPMSGTLLPPLPSSTPSIELEFESLSSFSQQRPIDYGSLMGGLFMAPLLSTSPAMGPSTAGNPNSLDFINGANLLASPNLNSATGTVASSTAGPANVAVRPMGGMRRRGPNTQPLVNDTNIGLSINAPDATNANLLNFGVPCNSIFSPSSPTKLSAIGSNFSSMPSNGVNLQGLSASSPASVNIFGSAVSGVSLLNAGNNDSSGSIGSVVSATNNGTSTNGSGASYNSSSPPSGSSNGNNLASETFSEQRSIQLNASNKLLQTQVLVLQNDLMSKTRDYEIQSQNYMEVMHLLQQSEERCMAVTVEKEQALAQWRLKNNELIEYENKLRMKNEELASVKDILKDRENALSRSELTKNSLIPELKQLRGKISQMEAELDEARKKTNEFDKMKSTLTAEIESLKNALQAARNQQLLGYVGSPSGSDKVTTNASASSGSGRTADGSSGFDSHVLANANGSVVSTKLSVAAWDNDRARIALQAEVDSLRAQLNDLRRSMGSFQEYFPTAAASSGRQVAPSALTAASSMKTSGILSPNTTGAPYAAGSVPMVNVSSIPASTSHLAAPTQYEHNPTNVPHNYLLDEKYKPVIKCSLPGCEQDGLHICTGCNSVGYCGVEHQKEHWKIHGKFCAGKK